MSETQEQQDQSQPAQQADAQAPANSMPDAQAPIVDQPQAPQTEPVKLELSAKAKKVLAYLSGLSKRALEMQIKSQMREGGDLSYQAMLEGEMQRRLEREKAKKG